MADARFAVVTGCAQGGIGEAMVLDLLKRGFHVIATRRSVAPADTAHMSHARLHWAAVDVTSDDSVRALAAMVDRLAGARLDLLVSNAGMVFNMPAVDVEPAEAERLMSTNVIGAMRLVHFLHRQLVAARGTIAFIGSITAVAPAPWMAPYNASKAALHQYGNTLRVELEPLGVRVVVVVGGLIDTHLLPAASRSLAPDSLYRPLEAEILASWNDASRATPAAAFADAVVATILKPNPPAWYWRGAYTNVFWVLSTFFPHRAMDWFYNTMFPLKKLSKL